VNDRSDEDDELRELISVVNSTSNCSMFHMRDRSGYGACLNKGIEQIYSLAYPNHEEWFIVCMNNDTTVNPGWLKQLTSSWNKLEFQNARPGILATETFCFGSNSRKSVGMRIIQCEKFKFDDVPSAVLYFMSMKAFLEFGWWREDYFMAGEDTDLCFSAWSKGYEVYIDEGVLINHIGKASAKNLPGGYEEYWRKSALKFKQRWKEFL
tara:strand:- start:372 stop:998 length:627 start_codon:yes stop_codon:yes gene_type:complete